ncbi:MAG: DUF3369 domain-containing protein [Alphaproteobacteria bacterium]|nr:DUF3369 domain-containing protein [Alphaproteobacteria bacterium]
MDDTKILDAAEKQNKTAVNQTENTIPTSTKGLLDLGESFNAEELLKTPVSPKKNKTKPAISDNPEYTDSNDLGLSLDLDSPSPTTEDLNRPKEEKEGKKSLDDLKEIELNPINSTINDLEIDTKASPANENSDFSSASTEQPIPSPTSETNANISPNIDLSSETKLSAAEEPEKESEEKEGVLDETSDIKDKDLDVSDIDLGVIDDDALGLLGDDNELDDSNLASDGTNTRSILPWVVLIVDDEKEIHGMTKMVIGSISYSNRPLELLSAYSAKEAEEILRSRNDIAIVLLDVVMETDDAGLKLAKVIRDDLHNKYTRIILRTGQPGAAPEKQIILDYDINDYKAKTELTSQKFFTTIISSLRSYEGIMNVEQSRIGLESIVNASTCLLQKRTLESFSEEIISQFKSIIKNADEGIICEKRRDKIYVLAASERWEALIGNAYPYQSEAFDGPSSMFQGITKETASIINETFKTNKNIYHEDYASLLLKNDNSINSVVYLSLSNEMDKINTNLSNVFCANIATGFENIRLLDKNALLYNKLQRANSATVLALAKFAEFKDNDTGSHVIRVKKLTELITKQLHSNSPYSSQISDLFLHQIGMAAILHDVGKIGTPNEILQKKGRLTPEERVVMEKHAEDGGKILSMSAELAGGFTYLSLGAEIAWGHHEWWSGGGYPRKLSGTEIPLSARIVAVVDVFDALVSVRPYKEAWPIEKAVKLITENAGKQFDPIIVKAFLKTLTEQSETQKSELGKTTQELYDEMKEQIEHDTSFSQEEFDEFMETDIISPETKEIVKN